MKIPEKIWNRVKEQLNADCGISRAAAEESGRQSKKTILQSCPGLPEKGHLTDAAYGELIRECLAKKTGTAPRVYEGTDLFFRGIVFSGQARILAAEEIFDWCAREYGGMKHPEWLCQFGSLRRLDRELIRHGRKIEDVRLNFLPGESGMQEHSAQTASQKEGPVPFDVRLLEAGELSGSRQFSAFRHAVCGSGRTPDVLAAAAVQDGRIVGMAGATQDCEALWQIGVEVDEARRGKGMARILVSFLKEEILRRGKIPFYATSQSHIVSMNTALGAGFLPAWTEIYVSAGR